jgi:hypothetical protein
VTHYDPNDPNPETVEVIRTVEPGYTETVETVVVRESNAGWWIAGVLGALVLLAVLWILFARGEPATDEALLDARLDAAEAQAQRDAALVQGQVAGAQASVDVARANAAAADAQARAAEARSATPVVIEREVPVPVPAPAPADPAVVSPTSPQN